MVAHTATVASSEYSWFRRQNAALFERVGKPEPLGCVLFGHGSRRINDGHRFVYMGLQNRKKTLCLLAGRQVDACPVKVEWIKITTIY